MSIKKTEKNFSDDVNLSNIEINTEINTTNIPERDVKVRLRKNHRCTIGKTTYIFEKGKTYTVPLNVKHILSSADLLLPLLT